VEVVVEHLKVLLGEVLEVVEEVVIENLLE
jgi:hypothetical protein